LEGTLKIIWFQPPCNEQGHLPLDQVAQSSIEPGLEQFQGGGKFESALLDSQAESPPLKYLTYGYGI